MEHSNTHPRRKVVLLSLFGLVLLLLLYTGYKAARLYPIAQQLKQHGYNVAAFGQVSPQLLANSATLQGAAADLQGLESALTELRQVSRLELVLLPHLGWVPVYGGDLAAAPVLLELGIESAAAGHTLIEGLLAFVQFNEQRPLALWAEDESSEIAIALNQAGPHFQQGLAHFNRAMTLLEQLEALPPAEHVQPYLDKYLPRLKPLLPLARLGLEAAAHDPAVLDAALGLTRPRTYLLLLQNPWEQFPAGGFITALVQVQVAGGQFELSPFMDIWDLDSQLETFLPAPASLHKAMWAGGMNLKVSNWSPDFPTSAGWTQALYQLLQEVNIDGSIALDPTVVQYILEAIGPVNVPAHNTTVSAGNLWQQMITFHSNPAGLELDASMGEKFAKRKEFLPLLAAPLLAQLRASATEPETAVALAQNVLRALDERHLLIAIKEQPAAEWLAQQGWNGALWQGPGDYVQVVDANVGFNKVNARVEKEIAYKVELGPHGNAIAQVTITYTNHSQVDDPEPCAQVMPEFGYEKGYLDACYWNYLRLYVPAGSQLLNAEPERWPANSKWDIQHPTAQDPGVQIGPEELGKQVFGLMVLVPPGKEQTVRFQYTLPANMWNSQDGYRLHLQKQSGTTETPVRVMVHLPPGLMVMGTNSVTTGAEVSTTFTLRKDETLEINLAGPLVEELAARPTLIPSATPMPTLPPSPMPSLTPTRGLLITPTPPPPTSTPTPVSQPAAVTPTATPVEPEPAKQLTWFRVQIPAVNIDGAVVQVGWQIVGVGENARAEWEVAAYAAGHHTFSAYPGENDNVVLSGHHNILGEVFRDLWELQAGDEIFLTDSNGAVYRYVTRQVDILLATGISEEEHRVQMRYMDRTGEPTLTLITCWPYETNTHRVLVVADLAGVVDEIEIP